MCWIFCDALFVVVFEDATIFCNNSKMITKDSIMRCVGFLVILDATIFCNKLTSPKRRFWKDEQKMKSGFRMKHFSRA